ncbi:hypothetical protein GOP47_0001720 [Adiantum capillus-veneris]|uniref:Uncharacterized protein n=1 Tax=Adiantum capillus-veneris TaxID=13818 RepID=A0A9D4V9D1_ADICA|nr:hypothetical protein GOP47_0001720 [Adiantum capillus-veneris]
MLVESLQIGEAEVSDQRNQLISDTKLLRGTKRFAKEAACRLADTWRSNVLKWGGKTFAIPTFESLDRYTFTHTLPSPSPPHSLALARTPTLYTSSLVASAPMASEVVSSQEQTKALEGEVAGLSLQEKAGVISDAVNEYVDGVSEAGKISAKDVAGELNGSAKETSEVTKVEEEKPSQDSSSREVNIAEKEAQKSPGDGVYVVPAVDQRSIQQPGGEEKVEVPTGVVHENVDPSPPQQGKGLIHSITQSVRSVFSGLKGAQRFCLYMRRIILSWSLALKTPIASLSILPELHIFSSVSIEGVSLKVLVLLISPQYISDLFNGIWHGQGGHFQLEKGFSS